MTFYDVVDGQIGRKQTGPFSPVALKSALHVHKHAAAACSRFFVSTI